MNEITPGFVWQSAAGDTIDLREEYPLPTDSELQAAYDSRTRFTVDVDGADVRFGRYNAGAGKRLFHIPGFGVTQTNDSGARSAALTAAVCHDYEILWPEEVVGMKPFHQMLAAQGDFSGVAQYYLNALHAVNYRPDVLSGHSQGSRVQIHVATSSDMAAVKGISLSEPPGAKDFRFPLMDFGILRAGLLENIYSQSKSLKAQAEDEHIIAEVMPEGCALEFTDGVTQPIMEKLVQTARIIRGLGRSGLQEALENLLASPSTAPITIWHGSKNLAMPIAATRQMVNELQKFFPGRVRLFESPTRHNSGVAHSAKFARQIRWVADRVTA